MPYRCFRRHLACALGFAGLTVAGCAPIIDQRGNLPDPAKLAEIQPGVTTKDAIAQLLGTPSSVSTFNDKTWYYISKRTEQTAFWAPEVKDQHVVIVAFDDAGVVREVEQHGLADSRPIDPSTRVTPSAGHELGFFEQLIGNLGKFNKGSDKSVTKTVRPPGTPTGPGY